MRFATSCFNPTLYRKNLARFWPLWVSWTVLWLFLLPLSLLNTWNGQGKGLDQYGTYRYLRICLNWNDTLINDFGLLLGAVYAVLIVMAVYGYLFNHRSAATIHALPMNRETLFITNYLSGLTFFLLPGVITFGLGGLVEVMTLPAELSALSLPCLWSGFWAFMEIQLFFYSFAVFCAQFTGNVLALPAFYGILNCLVIGMYSLCSELAQEIFFGGWPFIGEPAWVEWLTPYYGLYMATGWNRVSWGTMWDNEGNYPLPDLFAFEFGFNDPGRIALYALAGIALTAAALLVYRKRHIETAGDVVSVKVVRPAFRIGVAVCAGLCGGILTTAFFGWGDNELLLGIWIVFWTVVGYFAAQMLLHKSFRVFKKSVKGCAVTALVMAACLLACFMDVFGVETWVPKVEKVESVQIHFNNTFPLDEGAYLNLDITDPAQVEKIVDLHQSIVDDYKEHGEDLYGDHWASVYFNYLIDGRSYRKSYNTMLLLQDEINEPGTTTEKFNAFVNDPDMIDAVYGMDMARAGKIVCASLRDVIYPTGRYESVEVLEGAEELWEAVQADFAAGNLGRRYLFDDEVRQSETYRTDLTLRFLIPEQSEDAYYNDLYEELYYERYATTAEVKGVEPGRYTWNFSTTVTLTPKAQRTIAVLEKYSDLGKLYDIATHDDEAAYLR